MSVWFHLQDSLLHYTRNGQKVTVYIISALVSQVHRVGSSSIVCGCYLENLHYNFGLINSL